MIIKIMLVGLVMAVPVVVDTYAQVAYVWVGPTGEEDPDWTTEGHWGPPTTGYPGSGENGPLDTAVVDDISNSALVTLDQNEWIAGLFLGDGHTLELEGSLVLGQPNPYTPGWLEFDGVVIVQDTAVNDTYLTANWVTINTTQQTTVTFTDGDGDGCINTYIACDTGG